MELTLLSVWRVQSFDIDTDLSLVNGNESQQTLVRVFPILSTQVRM